MYNASHVPNTHIHIVYTVYICMYVFNQDLFIFILQRDFCRIPANPSSKFCRWLLLIIWKSGLIAGRKCPKGFQQSMAIKRFCIRHTFAIHTHACTDMHNSHACVCVCVCVCCAHIWIFGQRRLIPADSVNSTMFLVSQKGDLPLSGM